MVITSSIPFIILAALLLSLLSPSYCSRTSSTGLMVEEKSRLGSRPPSCENRCNMCHPCMAVEVPTTPSRRRVDPSSARDDSGDGSSSSDRNRYSNYKPLGWKCRCQGHFYNP